MTLSRRATATSTRPAFQRFVLLSEDAYRGAIRCLEKIALERTMDQSQWFERPGTNGGTLQRIEPPLPVPEQSDNVGSRAAAADVHDTGSGDGSSREGERSLGNVHAVPTQLRTRSDTPRVEHQDSAGHYDEHGVRALTTPTPAARTPTAAQAAPSRLKRADATSRAAAAKRATAAVPMRVLTRAAKQRHQDGSGVSVSGVGGGGRVGRLIKYRVLRVYR